MADSFIDFLSSIASTPKPVYGTSAEDVAQRDAIAQGAAYYGQHPAKTGGYLPRAGGALANNVGGATFPWNSPATMAAPSYGGNGVATPVKTSTIGGIDPATAEDNYYKQALTYWGISGTKPPSELLTGIGSYGGPASLSQPPQTASSGGYAPWGAKSRSLAFNAFNSPPPPPPPNVQLPRPRPGYAPNTPNYMDEAAPAPVGANPGMGGAMIGDGAMAPGIAPQGPPPPGIAPTVWAGDNPQQQSGPLNITVRGGKQPPPISSALKYTLANAAAQQAAKAKQATATGTAGGYQYENGQKVGYAPIAVGRGNYTPANGAAAYALSNLAGQQAAQQKQATATGQTGTTIYQNGQKVGNVGGGSAADAYAAAVKKNNSKSGSTSSGQSKTASDGSSWAANW